MSRRDPMQRPRRPLPSSHGDVTADFRAFTAILLIASALALFGVLHG